jgi:hypothetical protein
MDETFMWQFVHFIFWVDEKSRGLNVSVMKCHRVRMFPRGIFPSRECLGLTVTSLKREVKHPFAHLPAFSVICGILF